jgi:hypothetical protein
MRAVGRTGTYREPMIKLGAGRITCGACGFSREVPLEESGLYELWYAANFKGHRLWARNRKHLTFLISRFSGEINKADLGIGNRAMVEAFPKWMILAKHRAGLLKSLNRLAGIDASKMVQRPAASRSARISKRKPSAAGFRRPSSRH